jgi:hypothetical protein
VEFVVFDVVDAEAGGSAVQRLRAYGRCQRVDFGLAALLLGSAQGSDAVLDDHPDRIAAEEGGGRRGGRQHERDTRRADDRSDSSDVRAGATVLHDFLRTHTGWHA